MKIALVENFGADFVGARLRYALFLKIKGVEVVAIIPNDGHKEIIEKHGIKAIEVGANIRGKGLKKKLEYARSLKQIVTQEKFDIVHLYRLQPNLIGTFITGVFTSSKIVNHVTGLGVAFTNKSIKNLIVQLIVKSLYGFNNLFFQPVTVYQNQQDKFDLGVKKRAICIEGSAVNEDRFDKNRIEIDDEKIQTLSEQLGVSKSKHSKVLLFVSRLLKEKGVIELIEAVIQVNKELEVPVKLLIVGWSDSENPSAVKPREIEELIQRDSNIKFLGKRSDVDQLLALSDVSILPTYYREGTPRSLLEAMAMGKAIITTDMPGCNHLIPDGENGLLIEPKSVKAIKEAILELNKRDTAVLGENSYRLYFDKFSEKKVYTAIYDLYNSILS